MNKPLISILIPVFNREKLITDTIKSALNQTYSNIEIIIVDNNSSDNTWEILNSLKAEDERIKIFRNETNVGPHKNWKKCIELANGEYSKILWSDDKIESTFLEETFNILNTYKDIGFVITSVITETMKTGKVYWEYKFNRNEFISSHNYIKEMLSLGRYPLSPGCALFRTNDLKNNLVIDIPNSFESNFSIHGIGCDSLIFLKTAHQYPRIGVIKRPLSKFISHGNSITDSTKKDKLRLLYTYAQAYFVENHLKDETLIKWMNSRITLQLLLYKNNSIGLNSIRDFYKTNEYLKYSYVMILIIIGKNICKSLMKRRRVK